MVNVLGQSAVDLSYLLFQVPFRAPMPPNLQHLVFRAKREFKTFLYETNELLFPKPFRVHRFNVGNHRKKALVVHGWMSRSVHMMSIVRHLISLGYEVSAIDLPSHGSSRGIRLSWQETVNAIIETQRHFGPFEAAVGHSYGAAQLLNATAIGNISHEVKGCLEIEKLVLISALTKLKTATDILSKKLFFGAKQKKRLEELLTKQAKLSLDCLDGVFLQSRFPTETRILCVHDEKDRVIPFSDSVYLQQLGERVVVHKTQNLGHLKVIFDKSVTQKIEFFLTDQ